MRTRITGTYQDKQVRIEVTDGEITEGARELAALNVLGAVRAGAEVAIPGVWSGAANLEDPWAVRALFATVLEDPQFESDESLPDLGSVPDGAVS